MKEVDNIFDGISGEICGGIVVILLVDIGVEEKEANCLEIGVMMSER